AVSFTDEEGKQAGCKLVRLPRGTTECTDSEGNGQRRSVTIDPAGGRVDNIRFLVSFSYPC
ncbi:hypothetical protein L873DRAFT_1688800, partial [Choiromyces venosus 120613-1]